MMLLILLVSAIVAAAASGLPATNTATSLNPLRAPPFDQKDTNDTSTASLVTRGDEMEVGSSCHGTEGEWNCMNTAFQRCASGQWSMVLDTAYGTVCEPEGFTYEFQPAFASWYPPADTTETIVCTATATSPSGSTDETRPGNSNGAMTGNAAPHSALWAMVLGSGGMALLFLAM